MKQVEFSDNEFNVELDTWSSKDSAGSMSSNLKLPLAGLRWEDDGRMTHAARYGKYWNGSISNRGNARNMDFGASLDLVANNRRADGLSVRCIKDK